MFLVSVAGGWGMAPHVLYVACECRCATLPVTPNWLILILDRRVTNHRGATNIAKFPAVSAC